MSNAQADISIDGQTVLFSIYHHSFLLFSIINSSSTAELSSLLLGFLAVLDTRLSTFFRLHISRTVHDGSTSARRILVLVYDIGHPRRLDNHQHLLYLITLFRLKIQSGITTSTRISPFIARHLVKIRIASGEGCRESTAGQAIRPSGEVRQGFQYGFQQVHWIEYDTSPKAAVVEQA